MLDLITFLLSHNARCGNKSPINIFDSTICRLIIEYVKYDKIFWFIENTKHNLLISSSNITELSSHYVHNDYLITTQSHVKSYEDQL